MVSNDALQPSLGSIVCFRRKSDQVIVTPNYLYQYKLDDKFSRPQELITNQPNQTLSRREKNLCSHCLFTYTGAKEKRMGVEQPLLAYSCCTTVLRLEDCSFGDPPPSGLGVAHLVPSGVLCVVGVVVLWVCYVGKLAHLLNRRLHSCPSTVHGDGDTVDRHVGECVFPEPTVTLNLCGSVHPYLQHVAIEDLLEDELEITSLNSGTGLII